MSTGAAALATDIGANGNGSAGNAGGTGGTGGATANPPSGGTGTPPTDWTTGMNEDLRGYAQNKGFKDPGAVLDSYRQLEKTFGVPQERLLKLPEKSDDPAWKDIFGKLGRPEKPEGYELKAPEGTDGEFSKHASEWFHEAGISKKQAEMITSKWSAHVQGKMDAATNDIKVKAEAEALALKKEWGQAYDQNVGVAKQALTRFGITGDQITQIEKMVGFSSVMKLMSSIGEAVGEHNFLSGDRGSPGFGSVKTPAAAQSELRTLMRDTEFAKKLSSGDAESKNRWNQLNQWAYPEA